MPQGRSRDVRIQPIKVTANCLHLKCVGIRESWICVTISEHSGVRRINVPLPSCRNNMSGRKLWRVGDTNRIRCNLSFRRRCPLVGTFCYDFRTACALKGDASVSLRYVLKCNLQWYFLGVCSLLYKNCLEPWKTVVHDR